MRGDAHPAWETESRHERRNRGDMDGELPSELPPTQHLEPCDPRAASGSRRAHRVRDLLLIREFRAGRRRQRRDDEEGLDAGEGVREEQTRTDDLRTRVSETFGRV